MSHHRATVDSIKKVMKHVHHLLEQIVDREVDKDPLAFIRDETFKKEQGEE